jgi:hypothetical protein
VVSVTGHHAGFSQGVMGFHPGGVPARRCPAINQIVPSLIVADSLRDPSLRGDSAKEQLVLFGLDAGCVATPTVRALVA